MPDRLKRLIKRGLFVLAGVFSLGIVSATIHGIQTAGKAIDDTNKLDLLSQSAQEAGYTEADIPFTFSGKEYIARGLRFETEGPVIGAALVIPGNRTPGDYPGVLAMARGFADTGRLTTVLNLPDNTDNEVDGRNDWGTGEQAASVSAEAIRILKERDDLVMYCQSMGCAAALTALPEITVWLEDWNANNPERRKNITIAMDSPVVDAQSVIAAGATKRFGALGHLFSTLALNTTHRHILETITVENAVNNVRGLAEVSNFALHVVSAVDDSTIPVGEIREFAEAMASELGDAFSFDLIQPGEFGSKDHVVGVLYHTKDQVSYSGTMPVDVYTAFVTKEEAVSDYVLAILSLQGDVNQQP